MVVPFGFLDIGAPELLLILAIILLLFGGRKLPELSRSLGQSLKQLKDGVDEAKHLKSDLNSPNTSEKRSQNTEE